LRQYRFGHGTPTLGEASVGLAFRRRSDRSHLPSGRYIAGPFPSAGHPLCRPRSEGWEESGRKPPRRHPVDGTARRPWSLGPKVNRHGPRSASRQGTAQGETRAFGQGRSPVHRVELNRGPRVLARGGAPRDPKPMSSDKGERERNPCGMRPVPSGAGGRKHIKCRRKPGPSGPGRRRRNPHQPNQHIRAGQERCPRAPEEARTTPCRRNLAPLGARENRHTALADTGALGRWKKPMQRAIGNSCPRTRAKESASRWENPGSSDPGGTRRKRAEENRRPRTLAGSRANPCWRIPRSSDQGRNRRIAPLETRALGHGRKAAHRADGPGATVRERSGALGHRGANGQPAA